MPAGEAMILECVDRHFPDGGRALSVGRGDDCALFRPGPAFCVSSDLFLEDVHFRTRYFTPAEIGAKALAVNLSDLAACGARPAAFTLCLGLPAWADMPWLEDFFSGMAALAESAGAALCGGDLSAADKLHVSITVFGEKARGGAFPARSLARPGWKLFTLGGLGLARAGLAALESMPREDALARWPRACRAHLAPEPLLAEGMALARIGGIALMDVSDGLARDLPRMLTRSGCPGAELAIAEECLDREALAWARERGLDPVREAYLGGEDYALLGACPAELLADAAKAVPGLMALGAVSDRPGIFLNGAPCAGLAGFDHFERP